MEYYIAWWNVENLFDSINAPTRPEWLQKNLKRELKGWTTTVRDKKVSQLTKIIKQMNNNLGPDLLGVCEVENEAVMSKLVNALGSLNRNYQVVHQDTADQRGIDIAFIYDADLFSHGNVFSREILKRNATRDLLQVNFKTSNNNDIVLIGNHWPARMPSVYESEPYRIIAGETLAYWHERILEIMGSKTPILFMGDFNDDIYSRSITEYALSTMNKRKITNSRSVPRIYNYMWELAGQRIGTHYFDNIPGLIDQFMGSKGLILSDSKLKVKDGSVKIEMFPEMNSGGSYPSPIRFSRPSSSRTYNPDGFSDHYPISLLLKES